VDPDVSVTSAVMAASPRARVTSRHLVDLNVDLTSRIHSGLRDSVTSLAHGSTQLVCD